MPGQKNGVMFGYRFILGDGVLDIPLRFAMSDTAGGDCVQMAAFVDSVATEWFCRRQKREPVSIAPEWYSATAE